MELEIQIAGESGAVVNVANGDSQVLLTVPQETETKIYKERSLVYPRLAGNQLGLYNFIDMEGSKKVKLDTFKTPEYNLKAREQACIWDPDKGMNKRSDSMTVDEFTYQGEMCNAEIWGKCWRKLLGRGNQINDIQATPGGLQLLMLAIDSVHKGIGNDIYLVADFGGHPLLNLADENEWWRLNKHMDAKKWARLMRQQTVTGGHVTTFEALKSENHDSWNIELNPDEFVNGKFTGDTFELFDTMIESETDVMSAFDGNKIISVHPAFFNRHKRLVKERYGGIDKVYDLHKTGTDGDPVPFQVNPKYIMEYDGYYIYNRPEWKWLSKVTGCEAYMAAMNAAGSLAIGYDVSLANQVTGMGMDITYHKTGRFAGRTEFNANFELGTGLLGAQEYGAYASLYKTPK